jgi:sec-independent protein translocase protein TatB
MEFLGVGPLELLFIVLIILLVVGPKDVAKIARTLGQWLNRLYKSPNYQFLRRASDEMRNLPARLAREAQLDDLKNTVGRMGREINEPAPKPYSAWVPSNAAETTVKPAPETPPASAESPQS